MKSPKLLFTCLFPSLIALTGCQTNAFRARDVVLVEPIPGDGFVYVNDTFAGRGPVEVELWGDVPHRVTVRAEGFSSETAFLYPMEKNGGDRLITFGPLRDSGYYYELNTDRLVLELRHEMVPETAVGFDRDGIEAQLDAKLASGELTLEARAIAEKQLDRLFGSDQG